MSLYRTIRWFVLWWTVSHCRLNQQFNLILDWHHFVAQVESSSNGNVIRMFGSTNHSWVILKIRNQEMSLQLTIRHKTWQFDAWESHAMRLWRKTLLSFRCGLIKSNLWILLCRCRWCRHRHQERLNGDVSQRQLPFVVILRITSSVDSTKFHVCIFVCFCVNGFYFWRTHRMRRHLAFSFLFLNMVVVVVVVLVTEYAENGKIGVCIPNSEYIRTK